MSSIIQLECQCNNYPWGKTGASSLAAKYAASTPGGHFKLEKDKEYAEMWMGTYPTTPSLILSTGEDLQKHLNANKEKFIGKPILEKFGTDLPFLPKILSIAKALPLQIHPNKKLAASLHKKDPKKFGDSNHKPEIAVALSKFEVFVGFQPLSQITYLFTNIPILKDHFLPTPTPSTPFTHETLKNIVSLILSAPASTITKVYTSLRNTTFNEKYHSHIPDLLPRLAEQYSKEDPGTLVALLTMNYMVLQKREAIYVPADGIHAYLSGDIVECMARSDNVLNTGFCPSADRDSVSVFTSALSFTPSSAEQALLKSEASEKGREGKTKVLRPPMSEFSMLVVELGGKAEKEVVQGLGGPAVMVVTGGSGVLRSQGKDVEVKEGFVFFVGVGTEMEFEAGEDGFEAHIAFCEI